MTHNDSCEIRKDSFLVWTSRCLWLLKLSGFIGCLCLFAFVFDSVLKQFVLFCGICVGFKIGGVHVCGSPNAAPFRSQKRKSDPLARLWITKIGVVTNFRSSARAYVCLTPELSLQSLSLLFWDRIFRCR